MKTFSILDILFFMLLVVFFALAGYEIIQLLAPYYHFGHLFSGVMLLSVIYGVYKYESGNIFTRKIYGVYAEKKDLLLTIHLLATLFVILLSFYIGKFDSFSGLIILFLLHFLFAKIHGYSISTQFKGQDIKNPNAWRIFLITYAGFIIICSAMFRLFSLDVSLQNTYYIVLSVLYILGGITIFFDIRQFFQKENIGKLEIGIISLLLIFIGYIVFTQLL